MLLITIISWVSAILLSFLCATLKHFSYKVAIILIL